MTRVLVAENRADIRQSLQRLLVGWGYAVVEVDNASEALAMIDSQDAPELVLLDCDMLGFDRLPAIRQLRRRADVVATYLLVLRARKCKPLPVSLLRARRGSSPTRPEGGCDCGLHLEIGKATVDLRHQHWCRESAPWRQRRAN
jgi:CheY-like chemotaxis protein